MQDRAAQAHHQDRICVLQMALEQGLQVIKTSVPEQGNDRMQLCWICFGYMVEHTSLEVSGGQETHPASHAHSMGPCMQTGI